MMSGENVVENALSIEIELLDCAGAKKFTECLATLNI
jgi:hypothetical protein